MGYLQPRSLIMSWYWYRGAFQGPGTTVPWSDSSAPRVRCGEWDIIDIFHSDTVRPQCGKRSYR